MLFNKEILKLLNSEAGRYLLGIKENFPIVRFDDSWVEMTTGEFKNRKPLMKAIVWTYDHVAERIFSSFEKINIAEEYKPIDKKDLYELFLHFSGLELKNNKYPHILLDTTTKNPASGEGQIEDTNNNWATLRGQAAGSSNSATLNCTSNIAGITYRIRRGFLPMNTLTIGQITVFAPTTLQLYRDDSISPFANDNTTSIELVPSQQASGTSISNNDFGSVTFASRASLALASTTNGAYNTLTINDFTEITGTDYTKYAIITGRDLNNSAPTGLNEIWIQNRGAANPVKLNITYTPVETAGTDIVVPTPSVSIGKKYEIAGY